MNRRHGRVPKRAKNVLALEALERDLERGKPPFRRKRGKVGNLDDSGHTGLADFQLHRVAMSVLSAIYTLKNPRCSRPGWQDGSLWYDQDTRKMVLRDEHDQLVHKDTLHPVEAEKLVAGKGVE